MALSAEAEVVEGEGEGEGVDGEEGEVRDAALAKGQGVGAGETLAFPPCGLIGMDACPCRIAWHRPFTSWREFRGEHRESELSYLGIFVVFRLCWICGDHGRFVMLALPASCS